MPARRLPPPVPSGPRRTGSGSAGRGRGQAPRTASPLGVTPAMLWSSMTLSLGLQLGADAAVGTVLLQAAPVELLRQLLEPQLLVDISQVLAHFRVTAGQQNRPLQDRPGLGVL